MESRGTETVDLDVSVSQRMIEYENENEMTKSEMMNEMTERHEMLEGESKHNAWKISLENKHEMEANDSS